MATTVDDLIQKLSNFWDLLPPEDRVALRTLWSGYAASANDQWVRLFQVDLAKSIKTIKPTVRREWWYLPLNSSTVLPGTATFSVDHELVSAPKLQLGVTVPGIILVEQTDYTIDRLAHSITFTSPAAKVLIGPKISLTDGLGQRTTTGVFVDGGGLTGLTAGADYLLTASVLQLYSRAAFDKLGATKIPEALQAMSTGALFAPSVFTDENLVYRNFGHFLGIAPEDVPVNLETYTQVVKGLWYIAWNGPTPRNLKNGMSLLFGYPTAPADSLVLKVAGQDITITSDNGSTQTTITIPAPFLPAVAQGQSLREFDALSDAVLIIDEVNTPEWWLASLGLSKYMEEGVQITDPFRALQLKEQLKNHVFGIRLKDFNSFTDMASRSQILTAGSRFLSTIKPLHTQFAFLGDILFPEGTSPDTFVMNDVSMRTQMGRRCDPTVEDNAVNRLKDVGYHPTSPFADYNAYYASGDGGRSAGNLAYVLDPDDPRVTDSLTVLAQFSGSGGYIPSDGSNATYNSWANPKLADTVAPAFTLVPPPGEYSEEIHVRARPSEVCRAIYTVDGTTPLFGPPEIGSQIRDAILIRSGTTTLKIRGKDLANNVSQVYSFVYTVNLTLRPTTVTPSPKAGVRERASAQVIFESEEPALDIFYTLDGSAPSDFLFQDVERLHGHRIRAAAPTAIELENPALPVLFSRGTASINVDGPRSYEINTQPNRRYFVYLLWTGDKTWRVSFTRANIRFQPNTSTRLCVGFVITDASGQITQDGIINALDAGPVNQVTHPVGLPVGRQLQTVQINQGFPVSVLSDRDFRPLRFFGKGPTGLFDPPQRLVYGFDTLAPTTTVVSSETNRPFTRTLKIEVSVNEAATTYYSLDGHAPQLTRFGFPTNLNGLRLTSSTPNQVVPSSGTVTILFKRQLISGEFVGITTTADIRSGTFVLIPNMTPFAFYDVAVVPDSENAGKWRLDVGAANIPAAEALDRYLVARIVTDASGVYDESLSKGFLENAVDSSSVPSGTKTFKYIGPVLIDVTSGSYSIPFRWFSVDPAGNSEAVQSRVFTGG